MNKAINNACSLVIAKPSSLLPEEFGSWIQISIMPIKNAFLFPIGAQICLWPTMAAINKVAYAVVLIVQCHMCRNIDKDQLTDVMPLAIFVLLKPTAFIHLRISKNFCFVEQRKTCSCETWIWK